MKKLEIVYRTYGDTGSPFVAVDAEATLQAIIDRVNELSDLWEAGNAPLVTEKEFETANNSYNRAIAAGYSETDARLGGRGEGSTKTF